MTKEIIQKYFSWAKYCFDRDIKQIKEIVIHGTGGVPAGGIYKWVEKGERKENYVKGIALFHYLIELDGTIIQCLPLTKWTYHSTSGKHDKETIGIEIEKKSINNSDAPNEKQYKSLYDLLEFLTNKGNIKSMVSHDYNGLKYSPKKYKIKPCPNTFNWDVLMGKYPDIIINK